MLLLLVIAACGGSPVDTGAGSAGTAAQDGGDESDGGADTGLVQDEGLRVAGVLPYALGLAFDGDSLRSWREGPEGSEQQPFMELWLVDADWMAGRSDGQACAWRGRMLATGPASYAAATAWAGWDVSLELIETDCRALIIDGSDDRTGTELLQAAPFSIAAGEMSDQQLASLEAAYGAAGLAWSEELEDAITGISVTPLDPYLPAEGEPPARAWGLLYQLDPDGTVPVDDEGAPLLQQSGPDVSRAMVRGQALHMLDWSEIRAAAGLKEER